MGCATGGDRGPPLTGLVLGVQVSFRCRIRMRGVSAGGPQGLAAGGRAAAEAPSRLAASTREQAEASVARRCRSKASTSSSSAGDTRGSVRVGGGRTLPLKEALVSLHLRTAPTLQGARLPGHRDQGPGTRVRRPGTARFAQGQAQSTLLSSGLGRSPLWLLRARPHGMVPQTVYTGAWLIRLRKESACAFLTPPICMKRGVRGTAQCRVRAEPVEGSVHPGVRPGVERCRTGQADP